jgi:hypothetical protein
MITFIKKRKTKEAKKGSQREASKPQHLAKKEKNKVNNVWQRQA